MGNGVGEIRRYTINADGTLGGSPQVFTPFGAFTRTITGLAFEPGSTSTNLRLWVSHGALGNRDMANFTGKVTLVSGANLQTVQDKITGLPRSTKDHMNNGIAFGPDGKLYLAQGSLSGYGAPDQAWGFRAETPLSASILVADVLGRRPLRRLRPRSTSTPSTGYDPVPVGAAVHGLRDGHPQPVRPRVAQQRLAVRARSTSRPPATRRPAPAATRRASSNLPAGRDFLAHVQQGKYYGHPNPSQGNYVLNGGNPTAGGRPVRDAAVPGRRPARRGRTSSRSSTSGLHRSANGIDEYTSNVFGTTLRNKLLIAEYSNGDDIIAVNPTNPSDKFQIATGLFNPLDVKADPATGNVYVAEYGSRPRRRGRPHHAAQAGAGLDPHPGREDQLPAADLDRAHRLLEGLRPGLRGRPRLRLGGPRHDHTPSASSASGRDRNNANSNQLLDTFMHMQDTASR